MLDRLKDWLDSRRIAAQELSRLDWHKMTCRLIKTALSRLSPFPNFFGMSVLSLCESLIEIV